MRILVADDERDTAESLALLLKMAGHETTVAFDGAQVIEAATTFQPDVAILDIDMPIIDGLTAARLFARPAPLRHRPYLIAVTAFVGAHVDEAAKRAGFDFYMPKPPDVGVLLSIIERVEPAIG